MLKSWGLIWWRVFITWNADSSSFFSLPESQCEAVFKLKFNLCFNWEIFCSGNQNKFSFNDLKALYVGSHFLNKIDFSIYVRETTDLLILQLLDSYLKQCMIASGWIRSAPLKPKDVGLFTILYSPYIGYLTFSRKVL